MKKITENEKNFYESELNRTKRLLRAKEYYHFTYKQRIRKKRAESTPIKTTSATPKSNQNTSSSSNPTSASKNTESTRYRNPVSSRVCIWQFDDGTTVKKCM